MVRVVCSSIEALYRSFILKVFSERFHPTKLLFAVLRLGVSRMISQQLILHESNIIKHLCIQHLCNIYHIDGGF